MSAAVVPPAENKQPLHDEEHCTGRWTLGPTPAGPMIACTRCAAVHSASPDRADRALHENWVGEIFDVLVNQGVMHLDSDVSGN